MGRHITGNQETVLAKMLGGDLSVTS